MSRNVLILLIALALGAPLFGQEPKDTDGDTKEAEDQDEEKELEKPERKMSEAGKKLFEDCERSYGKYYEIVLEKFKANEAYKADDVWNEAVKEAKNAEYKDGKAFQTAIENMQGKDRVFKKKLRELVLKMAKENAEAIKKWTKENQR